MAEEPFRINARDFQEPLWKLAETMVQKVFREGPAHISAPSYVGQDIALIFRYAISIYNPLFYLNADERRRDDVYWNTRYGVTAMSLVRSLIDCLYNVTAILENPAERGPAYRKSGIKKTLTVLDEDQSKYAGQEKWEEYIRPRRNAIEMLIRASGFTTDEIINQNWWPTLTQYLVAKAGGRVVSANQDFLRTFTLRHWREYSALSHGDYEGFMGFLGPISAGTYYVSDLMPHDERPKIDASYDAFLTLHIGRAALVLLCMISELQAHCRFCGADINERICKLWDALMPLLEAKEGKYILDIPQTKAHT
jgi:hypothetical protein